MNYRVDLIDRTPSSKCRLRGEDEDFAENPWLRCSNFLPGRTLNPDLENEFDELMTNNGRAWLTLLSRLRCY